MKSRSLLFFYLLVTYVFASFIWWSYLLLQKNEQSFEDRIQLEKISFNHKNNLPESSLNYLDTPTYHAIHERYLRQKLMIIGEGSVFLLLLSVGCIRLWLTFRKEMALARQQNNFLLSITHELKSPLASMKLSLQTILKRVTLEDKFRRLAENSVEDVDRLTALVDNILFAVRMEDAAFLLPKEPENISIITNNVLQKIVAANSETAHIHSEIAENILLETDKMAFTSLLQNLVENAIKYSPAPAEVEVKLHKSANTFVLEVKDNGIGIPEKERNLIFNKFYRIGNEDTRNTKGTGIGLFIVKKIVEMHKGNITVADNQPKGTAITVEFPA
ncbi:MAG: ATP-binding protein [Chitinophagales bacterium]|nr:ATP-binding protein [Chitinophagales bacterium]